MSDPVVTKRKSERGDGPNFPEVVAISVGILLLFFLGAWLVLRYSGKSLLPNSRPDHEPHSYLQMPYAGAGPRAA